MEFPLKWSNSMCKIWKHRKLEQNFGMQLWSHLEFCTQIPIFRSKTPFKINSALNLQCVCSRPKQIAQWIQSLTRRSANLAVFHIFICFYAVLLCVVRCFVVFLPTFKYNRFVGMVCTRFSLFILLARTHRPAARKSALSRMRKESKFCAGENNGETCRTG